MRTLPSKILIIAFTLSFLAVMFLGILVSKQKCTTDLRNRYLDYTDSGRVPDLEFQSCGFGNRDNLGNHSFQGKILGFEETSGKVLLVAKTDGQDVRLDLGQSGKDKILITELFDLEEKVFNENSLTTLDAESINSLNKDYSGMYFKAKVWPWAGDTRYTPTCIDYLGKSYARLQNKSLVTKIINSTINVLEDQECYFKTANVFVF